MFLYKKKEYFPLEVTHIMSSDGTEIYNRNKREKSYVYISVENPDNEN